MKRILGMTLAFVALAALATFAVAGEEMKTVEVKGKLACAKCTLKIADAECQSVLVVQGEEGAEPTYYYLVDNEVTGEHGQGCKGEKAALVIGTVEEKDGKMWLTATKIKIKKPEA